VTVDASSILLTDRVVVVTGAARGIGRATALVAARFGARVAVCDRDADGLAAVTADVSRVLDVRDDDARAGFVAAVVAELGRVDVLVNNAGGTPPRAAMQTSERFFEAALRFNVTSAFLLSKLAARAMVDTAGEGTIVNISSRSSDMVQTGFVAYSAAKAALNMMTRTLASELAPRVRVNAISVGGVATQSLEIVLTDDTLRAQFEANTPMHRPGEPEDIACAALYLASAASSWVTGKVFQVDGGTEAPSITVPVPPLEPTPD
jgi:7-alpha-hydroxysteroid dehydrogenase